MYVPCRTDITIAGTLLVIPSISTGNVPQLAVDLIVSSLNLPLLGRIDASDDVYPFAGPRDNKAEIGITTPVEVFGNGTLTVIQVRSPVLPGHIGSFVSKLVGFAKEMAVSYVYACGSADMSRRVDPAGPKLISLRPPIVDQKFPGSGYLVQLLNRCTDMQAAGVVYYAHQGDNVGDATVLAATILDDLHIAKPQWTPPDSWASLYEQYNSNDDLTEVLPGLSEGSASELAVKEIKEENAPEPAKKPNRQRFHHVDKDEILRSRSQSPAIKDDADSVTYVNNEESQSAVFNRSSPSLVSDGPLPGVEDETADIIHKHRLGERS
ncbi:hypothetical protein CANCADRAFT_3065 [Tortispora caseinolytica NRRL Y-17796]|uniref:Proteasome assembly chaperone 2 n=1 Tax=Tortispora caseinolytica NRRL Y-17796 TaxID=767744 RepID=A0A1E4TI16_9ASCO|nr:hypothetical protein CANCADRAFT_3065 [Tortispora caseinolytica NRRL Y-17796]